MQRYTDVLFDFLSARVAPNILRGTVIIRNKEMVLEVELPGDRPYLIKGKARDGFYEGVHDGLVGDIPVHAKWTRLDNIWIGTWVEDATDWLFTFQLASPVEPSDRQTKLTASSRRKKDQDDR